MIDLPRDPLGNGTLGDSLGHPSQAEAAAEIAAAFTPELLAALPADLAALLTLEIARETPSPAAAPSPAAQSPSPSELAKESPAPEVDGDKPRLQGGRLKPICEISSPAEDNPQDDLSDPFSRLSAKQQHVVVGLCQGAPLSFLAREFGVSRRTIYRWKTHNELFQRALCQMQREWRSELTAQLHDAAELAVRNVASAVKKGKHAWLAFQLISQLGLINAWKCEEKASHEDETSGDEPPAPRRRAKQKKAPHNRIAGVE
jgi:hypothetical protein